jgi:DNA mismatch endonuclease, patch repair protein
MARPRIIKISEDRLKYFYFVKKLAPIEIARRFKCSERTIFVRLHKYKIPIRHDRERRDITEQKLRDLYLDKKISIGKIAEIFKCSKGTIWTKLCQYSIDARTKSEANKGNYKIEIPEEIKLLYLNDKLSISKIAKRFNCCCKSISQRLHDYNIVAGIRKIEISKKELEDLYIRNKMTICQIGERSGCSGVTILNRLREYNIPIRGKGELAKEKYRIEISKDRIRDLYIERKMPISEIKKIFHCNAATLRKRLERYGIHIRNISEALKGNPSPMNGKHHTKETRKKLSMLTVRQLASGTMKRQDTSIEIKVEEELKRNNIYYQKQIPLCKITVVDFYLPEYKVAIYADGDYWHNLPVVKSRDAKQNKILEEKGYQVLRFWEHEINRSVRKCINRIKEYSKF